MNAMIEIENLTKDFMVGFWKKHPFRALDGLTIEVPEGELFGFLGPNGAGKTTTLKMLMDLIRPTAGTARILGRPATDSVMKQQIGYLPENPYFYDYLTCSEFLTYYARLCSLSPSDSSSRVKELLDRTDMTRAAGTQLRRLSKGMLQRIGIAQAIIHRPRVVFLDEPMSGLDPLGRRLVREIVEGLRKDGVTVFFCSHILPDVEALCDRVAILNRGKLVECGRLDELTHVRSSAFEVVASRLPQSAVNELRQFASTLVEIPAGTKVEIESEADVERLLAIIHKAGGKLVSVNPLKISLEDLFIRELDDGKQA